MLGRFHSGVTFSLTLLFFLVTTPALYCQLPSRASVSSTKPLPVISRTSLCQALADPGKFDGKSLEIHATYSGTWEGTWLADSDCNAVGGLVLPFDHKVAKRYAIADVVRDRAWEEFDSARRRLYTGMDVLTPNG
jgi:hypothetical protein